MTTPRVNPVYFYLGYATLLYSAFNRFPWWFSHGLARATDSCLLTPAMVVMVTHIHGYSKNHWIVHFRWVNCMVCEYVNKAITISIMGWYSRPGPQTSKERVLMSLRDIKLVVQELQRTAKPGEASAVLKWSGAMGYVRTGNRQEEASPFFLPQPHSLLHREQQLAKQKGCFSPGTPKAIPWKGGFRVERKSWYKDVLF